MIHSFIHKTRSCSTVPSSRTSNFKGLWTAEMVSNRNTATDVQGILTQLHTDTLASTGAPFPTLNPYRLSWETSYRYCFNLRFWEGSYQDANHVFKCDVVNLHPSLCEGWTGVWSSWGLGGIIKVGMGVPPEVCTMRCSLLWLSWLASHWCLATVVGKGKWYLTSNKHQFWPRLSPDLT